MNIPVKAEMENENLEKYNCFVCKSLKFLPTIFNSEWTAELAGGLKSVVANRQFPQLRAFLVGFQALLLRMAFHIDSDSGAGV